jgi:type I restriction enzyme S subunit
MEVSNLEYIAELVKDKFCESQHSNLPLLDLARIPRKSLAIIGFGQSDEIKTSRIVFKEGNILFGAIRPYFHKVIIAPYDGVTNVSVFVLKNKNVVGNYYLFNLLFSDEVVKWATQYSGGTKMPVINWQVLKTMKVIVPPRESLMDFESMANNIFSLIKALNLKTVVLRTIREILLPKLISGELDVSEVDIIIRDNEGEKGR